MPLPKSITSLLTAIVVAIPAAITTLALNKPKPPKEIDAIIELDENNEVIDESEITPTPKPAPPLPPKPPESSQSSSGTPASGVVPIVDDDHSSGDVQNSEDTSSSTDSSPPEEDEILDEEEDESGPEEQKGEEEEEQETEPKDDESEQTPEDPEVPGSEDSQKDVTIEEMKKSLLDTIQKIIQEGSDFNLQSSGLLKLYNIKTGLEALPELINSLKAKIEENKKNGTSEGISGGSESSSSNGGSKGAKPGGEQS